MALTLWQVTCIALVFAIFQLVVIYIDNDYFLLIDLKIASLTRSNVSFFNADFIDNSNITFAENAVPKKQYEYKEDILTRLRKGEDIVVVQVGGSVAAGAHSNAGLPGAYPARFVDRLNKKYASSNTGHFRLYNMAHGCTHTFFSAVAMPSLVPTNTSIILWGHTENDVAYSDETIKEMMSLFMHSSQLVCPDCILGFAYTMRYGSFPGDNKNFKLQWPVILEEVKDVSKIFNANLGEYVRNQEITKEEYSVDGVHITDQLHDTFGKLLLDAAVPVLERTVNTTRVITTHEQGRNAEKYGQFHTLFQRSIAIKSKCVDEPTLNSFKNAVYDTKFTQDPKRIDYVKYVFPKLCPENSVYLFQKHQSSDFLLGLGLFGNYKLQVSGTKLMEVSKPLSWETCANSRDWPIWKYNRFKGTQAEIKICANDNTARLRYISFLELLSVD